MSDQPRSVIVAGARTPMGRLLGSLKDFSGADLGGVAIKGALDRAGVAPDQVDYVIMGQVLTAGAGQIPARQAAVKAGIPMTVPALTINKVCLSGLDAIALADQLIRAGEFEIVVAGGQESMTQAPHLLDEVPRGVQVRRRDDARPHGVRRALGRLHRPGDGWADRGGQRRRPARSPARSRTRSRARSHQLAARAWKDGLFDDEVVPGRDPAAQGRPGRLPRGRGHPRRHHGRVARPAASGVPQGRHHHRRLGLADLRRRRRRGRHEQGQGRVSSG